MSRLQNIVFPLCVRVCIARAYYPSDCVFLLSHLSHEGEKGMEKGKNGGAEDRKNACFRSSQRAKQRLWQRLSVKSYQTPDATAWNTVNYTKLWQMWQQKAYNSCPYTRARTREMIDYRYFTIEISTTESCRKYTSKQGTFSPKQGIFSEKQRTYSSKQGTFSPKQRTFSEKQRDFDWETIRLFDETKVSFSNNTEVDVSRCGNPPNKSTVFDLPLVLFS